MAKLDLEVYFVPSHMCSRLSSVHSYQSSALRNRPFFDLFYPINTFFVRSIWWLFEPLQQVFRIKGNLSNQTYGDNTGIVWVRIIVHSYSFSRLWCFDCMLSLCNELIEIDWHTIELTYSTIVQIRCSPKASALSLIHQNQYDCKLVPVHTYTWCIEWVDWVTNQNNGKRTGALNESAPINMSVKKLWLRKFPLAYLHSPNIDNYRLCRCERWAQFRCKSPSITSV